MSGRHGALLARRGAGIGLVLVAAVGSAGLTSPIAGASPSGATVSFTPAQVVGALAEIAPSYPGGIAALGGLFDTGPCAGVTDAATLEETPACGSVLDQVESIAPGISGEVSLGYDGTTDSNTFAAAPAAANPVVPANPGLLVAFGDSVTSGHNATQAMNPRGGLLGTPSGINPDRTTTPGVTVCDDQAYSYAKALATLLGVPAGGYTNVAHSGATTSEVLSATKFMSSCLQQVQPAPGQPNLGSEIAQATALLAASPCKGQVVNVAVGTGGANDSNWVPLLAGLILRSFGVPEGDAPKDGSVLYPKDVDILGKDGAANCSAWVRDNWQGYQGPYAGSLAINVAAISLALINADPGAFVRYVGYYDFGTGSPKVTFEIKAFGKTLTSNLPYLVANCAAAITAGVGWTNGVQRIGVTAAEIIWLLAGNDPSRLGWVNPQCAGAWVPASNFVQPGLVDHTFDAAGKVVNGKDGKPIDVPGYPHPLDPTGTGAIANCVNLSLPRTAAGDLVPLGGVAAPPPGTPEAPLAALLPLIAAALLGAWVLRRHRARRTKSSRAA